MLPLNLSDTAATSQDGSSLEFIAAIANRQCYIQDASGRGLCTTSSSDMTGFEVSGGGRLQDGLSCFWSYLVDASVISCTVNVAQPIFFYQQSDINKGISTL